MYYEKDTALRASEILMTKKKNNKKPTKDINSDDAKKQ